MEEMQSMWGNLRLNEEEDKDIAIDDVSAPSVQCKSNRSLIGRIWCDRLVGKKIVEETMAQVWRISKPASVKEVGSNLFVFIFATHADKQKVENGRPWNFDNHLLVLIPFDGLTPIKELKFNQAPFWVQFHNLPLFGMNKGCGEQLGGTLGTVVDVEVDEDYVGWGRCLLVKVLLDIKKPLARGCTITLQGTRFWSPIQYEHLPRFCLTCGRLTHEGISCKPSTEAQSQYGCWLRADQRNKRTWLRTEQKFGTISTQAVKDCSRETEDSPTEVEEGIVEKLVMAAAEPESRNINQDTACAGGQPVSIAVKEPKSMEKINSAETKTETAYTIRETRSLAENTIRDGTAAAREEDEDTVATETQPFHDDGSYSTKVERGQMENHMMPTLQDSQGDRMMESHLMNALPMEKGHQLETFDQENRMKSWEQNNDKGAYAIDQVMNALPDGLNSRRWKRISRIESKVDLRRL